MKRGRRSRHGSSKKNITLRELYDKYKGVCQGPCGRHIPFSDATKDHHIPRSRGGSNKRSNLKLLCTQCNRIKADTMPKV